MHSKNVTMMVMMTFITGVGSSGRITSYAPEEADLHKDQRTMYQRIFDRAMSWLRETHYVWDYLHMQVNDCWYLNFDSPYLCKEWHSESQGLYALFHGLVGHPSIWHEHIGILKNDPDTDLFVPYVPRAGNGPLEEVAAPLLKIVEDYAAQHPGKPICLIGVSNGGRICTWLETQLRKNAPLTPVKVSTVAAVHFGSSAMDLVKLCHQWTGYRLGWHMSVMHDLCVGSDMAKRILASVSQPLPLRVIREYEFYGSREDVLVSLGSSMPDLGKHLKPERYVVEGYDHNGIVAGIAHHQAASCQQWMRKYR